MKHGLRVVAVVPVRGASDRVPYLNIKRLGDRSLLAHTLDAASASSCIDRVVVTTDDPRVAELARQHGAEAPFLRPAELSAELSSLKPVIVHAVRELEAAGERCDVVVVLQATTPFRTAEAIDAAVERLVSEGFDGVISVTEDRTLNWREQEGRLQPAFEKEGRRAEQPALYRENGAVVALRREVLAGPTRFGEKVGALVLDKRAGFTVHDLDDLWMAERLLRHPRILFRVDGSPTLGMGHVFRSLAIADALREGSRAEINFLMSTALAEGRKLVAEHGYPVRVPEGSGLEAQLEGVREFAPVILINDLPRLEAGYLEALSHLPCTTVNLVDTPDDLETTEHYEQLIVSVMKHDRETPEGFYAGPEYAILREQFRGRTKQVREAAQLVLLTFGGSDPQGLTVKAIEALRTLPDEVALVAVTGPAFTLRTELEAARRELQRPLDVIHEASGAHIADLMLEADLVVCSGGMSVYEIAALGTPGLVLAQNTREDARMRAFAGHGTIEYLGLGPDVEAAQLRAAALRLLADAAARRTMSARGRALVDGFGAARAAEVVLASLKT